MKGEDKMNIDTMQVNIQSSEQYRIRAKRQAQETQQVQQAQQVQEQTPASPVLMSH